MIRYVFFLLSLLFLSACVTQSYEVQSVCEVTDVYNYVVKWEVSPRIEGEVEIYSSPNPQKFDLKKPVGRELISKGRADIVIKGSLNRCYFLLKFPDNVETIVGVRCQKFPTVENFRDVGGYVNVDYHALKWGKLYRSGRLDSISEIDAKRVAKMKVKTIIDLRSQVVNSHVSTTTGIKNQFHFPIIAQRPDPLPLVYRQQFKRGDAIVFMQDVFRDMVLANNKSFRRMFDILLEEKNYPVILSCRYGNIQSSIAMALILGALDVPEQTIIDDYLLSNKYFNMRAVAAQAMTLPLESQDAITSMMVSDERYLNSAFEFIKRKYGSVKEFLRIELGMDEKDCNHLKAILLE